MSTITRIPGGVCAPQGFTANGIHCGIRKNKTKHDLSVIYSDTRAATACVYTTNRVKGAPLTVTKNHIADGYAQAVICNSGNANTCNANGIEIAEQMSDLLGEALHISPADVVWPPPASSARLWTSPPSRTASPLWWQVCPRTALLTPPTAS